MYYAGCQPTATNAVTLGVCIMSSLRLIIKVTFLYFRPPNEDEMKVKGPMVISCDELKQEVTATLSTAVKQINKTFLFDKVFFLYCISINHSIPFIITKICVVTYILPVDAAIFVRFVVHHLSKRTFMISLWLL